MKIIVISDTHSKLDLLKRYMDRTKDIDVLIHLGDYCRDAQKLQEMYGINVISVKGNCDLSQGYPMEKTLMIENKRVFLTHGHRLRVKYGNQHIIEKGQEVRAHAVLFGHTHIPEIFNMNGIVFLNPGSIGEPRMGNPPTLGVLNIQEGFILPEIIRLPLSIKQS